MTSLFAQNASAPFQDAFSAVAKLPAAFPKILAPFAGTGAKLFPHFFTGLGSKKQRNRCTDP